MKVNLMNRSKICAGLLCCLLASLFLQTVQAKEPADQSNKHVLIIGMDGMMLEYQADDGLFAALACPPLSLREPATPPCVSSP